MGNPEKIVGRLVGTGIEPGISLMKLPSVTTNPPHAVVRYKLTPEHNDVCCNIPRENNPPTFSLRIVINKI